MGKDTEFRIYIGSGGDWIRNLSYVKQNTGYKNWSLGFSQRLQILSSCSWAGKAVQGLLQYRDIPIMSPAAKHKDLYTEASAFIFTFNLNLLSIYEYRIRMYTESNWKSFYSIALGNHLMFTLQSLPVR